MASNGKSRDGGGGGFTPTEVRILNVLADGHPHSKAELLAVIDEQADANALRVHIHRIRKKLEPHNQTIDCVSRGKELPVAYRHLQKVSPASLKMLLSHPVE